MTDLYAVLKRANDPVTLFMIAAISGALVRVLKTQTLNDFLEWVPVSWVKRIPKTWYPRLAILFGVIITMLDAKMNGGIATWKEALAFALYGAMAGGTAVAGHETLAKLGKKSPPDAPAGSDSGSSSSGSSSGLQRAVFLGAACLALLTGIPSCAGLAAALPHIIAAVVEAGQVLDAISTFLARYFKDHPDPVREKQAAFALAKCRTALNVLMRAAEGTDNAQQEKIDAAFEDFKAAYLELIKLVQPYGVRMVKFEGMSATSEEVLQVPEPIAFKPRKP